MLAPGSSREYRQCARQRGFTMVELIMVIVIMGVIGGMVAVFMKSPIDAYIASGRRAALNDVADTVVRRMARDIRKSLPNSIRTPANQCVEFIPTKTGGRYRADDTVAGLSFVTPGDTSFNMLGSNATFAGVPLPVDQQIVSGDVIVVYNLGIPGANAYDQSNTATVNGAPVVAVVSPPEAAITVTSSQPSGAPTFPFASGNHRFQVVSGTEQVVRYTCVEASGVDALGRGKGALIRQVLTLPLASSSACPITAMSAGVLSASVMAINVSSCSFDYSGSDLQRNALVSMRIQITESDETVSLQHEVHVNNTP